MYSYYLSKGHTLDSLLSLSYVEKLFYAESMLFNIEQENKKIQAMAGGK